MLELDTRQAILRLASEGHGIRTIAKALNLSRNSVRRVLRDGKARVPGLERPESALPHLDQIRDLYVRCEGNLVRVNEELEAIGIHLGYSTLTGFCRRHHIGVELPKPVGRYSFAPGEEMQHDTSPHVVMVGGTKCKLQCASLVLCHSRMVFAQVYARFTRFWCKVFLTDAVTHFGGAANVCMLDNSHVVVAHGTGRNAVMAPEMVAFAERFGFHFESHELGDADRSANVERRFHHIEHNFYSGRSFSDLDDLNTQLRTWCDNVNSTPRRSLGHVRAVDLFQAERLALRKLPLHVPEVYLLHERIVDMEGYVNVHTCRYSVPVDLIGRRLEVRETRSQIRIFDGHRLVCEHRRRPEGCGERLTLPEHRHHDRWRLREHTAPLPEEVTLRAAAPELAPLIEALNKHHGGRSVRPIRVLHRLWRDYPREALAHAVTAALEHGLLNLERIESMVLRDVAGNFFRLPEVDADPNADGDNPDQGKPLKKLEPTDE
jgi:transposase